MIKDYLAYIKDNPKNYWFKAKLFGWGWFPVKWQGWLVLLVYVVALTGLSFTIDKTSSPREVVFTFLLPVALLTIALICICYKTGEKPHWQWGLPRKKEDESGAQKK